MFFFHLTATHPLHLAEQLNAQSLLKTAVFLEVANFKSSWGKKHNFARTLCTFITLVHYCPHLGLDCKGSPGQRLQNSNQSKLVTDKLVRKTILHVHTYI